MGNKDGFFTWLVSGVDMARADLVNAVVECKNAIRGWADDPKFDIDKDFDAWKERVAAIPEGERPEMLSRDFFRLLDSYHDEYLEWLEEQP